MVKWLIKWAQGSVLLTWPHSVLIYLHWEIIYIPAKRRYFNKRSLTEGNLLNGYFRLWRNRSLPARKGTPKRTKSSKWREDKALKSFLQKENKYICNFWLAHHTKWWNLFFSISCFFFSQLFYIRSIWKVS